jgi:DNA-binding NarL/FixJ family response regulator
LRRQASGSRIFTDDSFVVVTERALRLGLVLERSRNIRRNRMTPSTRNAPGAKTARILIVDDHPIVREAIAARILSHPDLHVCGEADDVADALEMVKTLRPDLVIVDLTLKSGQGLDLIKKIKAMSEETKTLVSSACDETLYAERALRAGAVGYINKQAICESIVDAVRHVLAGKMYLSRKMTERLLERAVGGAVQFKETLIESLTDRELEIFTMIGNAVSTRKIAQQLQLSVKTVETHRERIKQKLSLSNGAELSREAVRWVLENSC